MFVTAKIGVGDRVHILEEYAPNSKYGMSLCGWSGYAEETNHSPTCWECMRIAEKMGIKSNGAD